MLLNKCRRSCSCMSYSCAAGFTSSASRPLPLAGADRPPALYTPPKKVEELFSATEGNKFKGLNSAIAGPRFDAQLPRGKNSFQLYSLATPNGQKAGIILEEIGAAYDAHLLNILDGAQFSSGFVEINPNSKVPAAVDYDGLDGNTVHLSESASIVLYLAKKHNCFLPVDFLLQVEVMNWVFWQMSGQGPMSGNFGHFMVYAPENKKETRDYGIARYGMEVQRLCSVLDRHLDGKEYMVGGSYSVADIMIFPWFHQMRTGYVHKQSGVSAASMLSIEEKYPHAVKWADRIFARPAVQRGMLVCQPPRRS